MAEAVKTDRLSQFRARIARSKQKRRNLVPDWRKSVNYRGGKPFDEASDNHRIAVPVDWSMTKSKQAQLFSQVPELMLMALSKAFAPAVAVFAKKLNDTMNGAKVGSVMDELTADCINAAGVGAAIVRYESRTQATMLPAIDPSIMPLASELPPIPADQTIDRRFLIERISPGLLLWPSDFDRSDFNEAPWIGRTGYMTRAQAKRAFDLSDAELENVKGGRDSQDRLVDEDGKETDSDEIAFDELFYWRHLYHSDELYYKAIHHLVFIDGIEKPVIDEPWSGQKFDQRTGKYLGACKFPIQVLTLTYVSDTAIPPSDSAIGRPQVNELIESRSQMVQNRKHSQPLRWGDTNRMDQAVIDNINNGGWQNIIPVQGNGNSIMGEIARASYPNDDYEFDRVAKSDLMEAWQTGPNQGGAFNSGARTAKEAEIVQANFSTRIGYERARVAAFYVGLGEVMAGLLALYGDFEVPEVAPEDAERLAAWDRTQINQEFVYSVKADSTVLLDANQQLAKIEGFLNRFAKTGWVVMDNVMRKAAELSGLDPEKDIKAPTPKPEPLNLSVRNAEDMRDPLVLAALVESGQAPKPEAIDIAKQLLIQAAMPPQMPQPPAPAGPPQEAPKDEMPDANMLPRIDNRRSED